MPLTPEEFKLFRDYVHKECALDIDEKKSYLIESRLKPLLRETQAKDYRDFYNKVVADRTHSIRDKIVDSITTHETLWFRDGGPWRAIEEKVLPELAELIRTGKRNRVRIWSAACSTGQEPYSLVMLIDKIFDQERKFPGVTSSHFEILGTDVSKASVGTAQRGRYNRVEMSRGIALPFQSRYFDKEGMFQVLKEQYRRRVQYKAFNLKDSFLTVGRMDMVLCRNVLIYFSEEFKHQLIRRIAMQLNPGGYFFLGATESGHGHTNSFDQADHKGSIYYKLKKF